MTFDNQKTVARLNIRRYIVLLVYFISILLLLMSNLIKRQIFGYDKSDYAIVITVLYILYVLFVFIMNYNYFHYNDEGDKLVFRFVSLRPFDNKRTAIEINKKDFEGFKIEKSLFNIKQDLVVRIRTKNGIANYPSISLTALPFKHRRLLENSLNKAV